LRPGTVSIRQSTQIQELDMATITASMFMALDGVVDPAVGNWHFPYFNDEMGEAVTATHEADVMLFGRVTYDSFAGAWPGRESAGEADADFAKRLGDVRKIVVSHEPLEFTWRNSEQLKGDLVESVTALKADPSVDRIALSGSVSVVRQLLGAGLVDELHLFVHPVLAGSGLRLFAEGAPELPLRLLGSTPFATGVIHLVYGPDPSPPTGGYDEAKGKLPEE
jgi:dihydrofolate reductase